MMRLGKFLRVLVHVVVALTGVGGVAIGLGPVACYRRPAALGLTGPGSSGRPGWGLRKCRTTRVVRPGSWRAYTAHEKARAWVGCPW